MIQNEKISMEDQKEYLSGTSLLLFLIKHSRPDTANIIREVSKANDGVNPVAYEELLHMIKYVLDKKILWLAKNCYT